MGLANEEALETISKVPEDADMEEIMCRLHVLDKIRKGQDAADNDRITGSEELQREVENW